MPSAGLLEFVFLPKLSISVLRQKAEVDGVKTDSCLPFLRQPNRLTRTRTTPLEGSVRPSRPLAAAKERVIIVTADPYTVKINSVINMQLV